MNELSSRSVDVVILGGGMAGLTLARHLLLLTDRTVHVVERLPELPPKRQKVGESTVQLAGYYLSKVLEMEDHLFFDHLMKYNLRFYWKTRGRANDAFEDYSSSYIRSFSNIPSFQIDRNVFEAELLRRNAEYPDRFGLDLGADPLAVELCEEGDDPHVVRYEVAGKARELRARWVVDATGRRRFLAKERELRREQDLGHGSFFWWVEGLVDVEKLSGLGNAERRLRADRRTTGHTPAWVATNHFMDEGLWVWVIPLQGEGRGRTSLGIVYDHRVVHPKDVLGVEKATQWLCERFPLFARDLPGREVVAQGGFRSYAHDCAQVLHAQRWALTGEAGRFSDPLYSPGSDLIAIHNTLIVSAIEADAGGGEGGESAADREQRCRLYESLTKAVFQAYLPTYSASYDALGDAETMSLKYSWELSIYFALYVFPFVNDLFTDRRFLVGYLRRFARLGPWNRGVQALLSGYFQWKKEHAEPLSEPVHMDFTEIGTLARAADTFFEVGLDAVEARKVLDRQLDNLEELARFLAVHVASVVLDDPAVLKSRAYAESIDVENITFDPAAMAERWRACRDLPDDAPMEWSICTKVLERFRTGLRTPEMAAAG